MSERNSLQNIINEVWRDAYPDCSKVKELDLLRLRVIKLGEDRKCWIANAKTATAENAKLEKRLKEAEEKIRNLEDKIKDVTACPDITSIS